MASTKAWHETVPPFFCICQKEESHHVKKVIHWIVFVHYVHELEREKIKFNKILTYKLTYGKLNVNKDM